MCSSYFLTRISSLKTLGCCGRGEEHFKHQLCSHTSITHLHFLCRQPDSDEAPDVWWRRGGQEVMKRMAMKVHLLVWAVVLSISSISRGENVTSVSAGDATGAPDASSPSPRETSGPPATQTAANRSDRGPAVSMTPEGRKDVSNNSTEDTVTSTAPPLTPVSTAVSTAVSTGVRTGVRTGVGTGVGSGDERRQGTAGYVVLGLIVLVIIVLSVILYFLKRASQTYSFDLHSAPAGRPNQPVGTFERVHLSDLDRPPSRETAGDLSPPAVSNGSTRQAEERRSDGGSVPPGEPDASGPETPPTGADPPRAPSPYGLEIMTDMFFNAVGVEQENENNPAACSRDPFVEINLDEVALCHQLLAPPPSSLLPISFSSSSASSSCTSLHIQ